MSIQEQSETLSDPCPWIPYQEGGVVGDDNFYNSFISNFPLPNMITLAPPRRPLPIFIALHYFSLILFSIIISK